MPGPGLVETTLHREIEKLANELHDAAGVIDTLGAGSACIGTVDVMRTLAEQTNLLAMARHMELVGRFRVVVQ